MSSDSWHLDKRIPIAFMLTLLLQTGSMFYWGGEVENRVANLENHGVVTDRLTERIRSVEGAVIRLDVTMGHLNTTLGKLEQHLEKRER